jgi:2-amino-4-hydroxy-6-hydroxymethyldihydropteridine diphosphokinase
MNQAYILLGGNTGNRFAMLQHAKEQVAQYCGKPIKISGIYETAAWGREDQPAFLNQVIHITTELDAPALLMRILDIEKKMGRVREEKYAPRTIDIDILYFNREVVQLPQLVIPHPEIQNRRFVLVPLQEIAPRKKHPVLNKTTTQLLKACSDPLEVKRYTS